MKIFFQDNCIPSRISVLLLSFHYKAWIFGAAYYWLIWLLLLSVLVGSLYSGKYSLLIGWYKAILISDWLFVSSVPHENPHSTTGRWVWADWLWWWRSVSATWWCSLHQPLWLNKQRSKDYSMWFTDLHMMMDLYWLSLFCSNTYIHIHM